MRILGFTHTWPRSEKDHRGVFLRQMYEHVTRHGHDVDVLVPRTPGLAASTAAPGRPAVMPFSYFVPLSWSTFGHGGALTGEQKLARTSKLLAPLYGLASIARIRAARRRYDLVHAHWLVPNGTLAAMGAPDVPLVVTLHGSDVYLAEKSGAMAKAARYAMERASAIVPVSEDLARRAIALGADEDRVTVIPCGADPTVMSRATGTDVRARMRASVGAGDRPLFLYVGNLLPKKGVIHLVRAAAQVRARRPDALFVLAGEGALRPELEAEAARLSLAPADFRFLGQVEWSSIPDWYAAADVFVAPSVVDPAGNVDGLPTTVPEAMASGLPVVSTTVAGIPMAVRSGETGLLVPPEDEPALAEALLSLAADPAKRKAMGEAGRKRLDTELSWERISRRYEELFDRVLAGSPREARGARPAVR